MKLLLVEDEPKLTEFIKRGLNENGFDTDIALDGHTGELMAKSGKYSLIILDVQLPYKTGYEICQELRQSNIHTPVLMLTAHSTTEGKLLGFDSGADDYLIKPFEFLELLARIKALLKRANTSVSAPDILFYADLEQDLKEKTVRRGNKTINLTAKEFALLEYFLRNKKRVISRVELAEKIWDITFDTGTNVIDVYVNFLRKKIDKDFQQKLIHTHIGFGYILK